MKWALVLLVLMCVGYSWSLSVALDKESYHPGDDVWATICVEGAEGPFLLDMYREVDGSISASTLLVDVYPSFCKKVNVYTISETDQDVRLRVEILWADEVRNSTEVVVPVVGTKKDYEVDIHVCSTEDCVGPLVYSTGQSLYLRVDVPEGVDTYAILQTPSENVTLDLPGEYVPSEPGEYRLIIRTSGEGYVSKESVYTFEVGGEPTGEGCWGFLLPLLIIPLLGRVF